MKVQRIKSIRAFNKLFKSCLLKKVHFLNRNSIKQIVRYGIFKNMFILFLTFNDNNLYYRTYTKTDGYFF